MKRVFLKLAVSFVALGPQMAAAEFFSPPALVNVVQFTRGDGILDVRKVRQVLDEGSGLYLGDEADCAFDVPPGTTQEDFWTLQFPSYGRVRHLTDAEATARRNAARARNALVFQHFPDWAASSIQFRIDTENALPQVYGSNQTRALYIAFGKIKGRYTKPDGEQTFEFHNHGEYVIERDGANTKGYYPVALCALLRVPRTY